MAAVALLAAGAAVGAQEAVRPQMPRMAVESRITRGAPYSGETVTESVQVLADGNRISRRFVSRIYRDSQGRTRREQLDPNGSGNVISVSISDPVAESSYVLDPQAKMAYRNGVIVSWSTGRGSGQVSGTVEPGSPGVVVATKMPDGTTKVEAGDGASVGGARVGGSTEVRERVAPVPIGGGRARGGAGAGGGVGGGGGVDRVTTPEHAEWATAVVYPPEPGSKTATEDLGQQVMEGVVASGKRTTTVLPVGLVGNEQTIEIVTEQWMSPELSVLIMTKHSDPRSGVNTYNLTNIVRAEPPRSLFEVPADYTLKDSVIRRQELK